MLIYQSPFLGTTIMPKRRRGDRSNNEVETVTFTISEDRSDNTLSSSTTTPTASTMFTPPLPEQVINVSEWTVGSDRVSTSNALFSSMVEPAQSMSFNKPDHHLHIPGAYYDVVDVSDFQPPPEPLQPSQSSNTESSKSSKERLLFSFSLIITDLILSLAQSDAYLDGTLQGFPFRTHPSGWKGRVSNTTVLQRMLDT